jgi:hypothetical protein
LTSFSFAVVASLLHYQGLCYITIIRFFIVARKIYFNFQLMSTSFLVSYYWGFYYKAYCWSFYY